jgi:hypothetical protein
MNRLSLGLLSVALMSMVAASHPAKADAIDPEFGEQLGPNSCPANCASEVVGTDPLSGLTTLEYIFKNTGAGAITSVVAGDELIREFGTTEIGDVIRFEDNLGPSHNSAVAFIFSDDTDGGGETADVGLPGSFQSVTRTITEDSTGMAGPRLRS